MAPTELPEAGRGRRPVTRGRQVSAARAAVSPAPAATRTGSEARGQQRARTRAQVGEHAPRTWGGGSPGGALSPPRGVALGTGAFPAHGRGPRPLPRRPPPRSLLRPPGNEPTASAGPARTQAAKGAGHGEPFAGSPSENRGLHASKTSLCPAAGVTAT